eukprot:20737-Chlamydomonas_euryale.AAC.2
MPADPSLLAVTTVLPSDDMSSEFTPEVWTRRSPRPMSVRTNSPLERSMTETVESKSSTAASVASPLKTMCLTREPCCAGSDETWEPSEVRHTTTLRLEVPAECFCLGDVAVGSACG